MAWCAGSGATTGFRAPSEQEYAHEQGTETREQTGGFPGPGAGSRQEGTKTLGERDEIRKKMSRRDTEPAEKIFKNIPV
jgi:hypothetical protein